MYLQWNWNKNAHHNNRNEDFKNSPNRSSFLLTLRGIYIYITTVVQAIACLLFYELSKPLCIMHRLLKNYWHWSHLEHEVLKNLLLVHYKPLGATSPEITTSILWHEVAKKPTVEALLLLLCDWDATVGTGPKPLKGVPSVVCRGFNKHGRPTKHVGYFAHRGRLLFTERRSN